MEESGARREKRKRSEDLLDLKMDLTQSENFVNYFSEPPSLQRIAAVSIAIRLWTEPSVMNKIITSFLSDQTDKNKMITSFFFDRTDFSELEESILGKLFNSSLPISLKTEVSYVIPPIRLQLLKVFCSSCRCTGYHKKLCEYYMKGGSIYWTVEGTIDIKKSLIELFNNENSENDICHLYEAACFYCLEEYISVLWKKVPAQIKNQFRIGRIGDTYKYHIVIYWTSVLENNLDCLLNKVIRIDYENIYDRNLSIDLNMITCSIRTGSVFALKYFWKKLTEEEKNANLDKWLARATRCIKLTQSSLYEKYNESLDVLCFLLSRVSGKTQLTEFFQDHSDVLMLLFESWPFQRMFLSTILDMLDNIHEDVYVSIMKDVCFKISKEGIEKKIFKEIWSISPSRLRRPFLQKKRICTEVVLHFLELEHLSLALTLFNDAPEEEIKQIICYMFGWSKFCGFIYTHELDLLCKLLSETTLPSECNLFSFRRNLTDGIQTSKWYMEWHMCNEWIKEGDFQVVETFLKWAFQSVDEVQDFKKEKLNPYIIYTTLIIMCNYERVEWFLKWYFETEEEIQQFKKDFLHDDNNSHFKFLLCELCLNPSKAWDVMKKFVSFCRPSSVEMTELKLICLNSVEKVLQKRCYEFATILLNWSLDSTDEVKRYKNNFVLSEKGIKNFLFFKKLRSSDKDWNDVEDLIKWSLPLSKETITELKSLIHAQEPFYSCKPELNLKVIALLDSVVEYDSSSDCHNLTNAENAF